MADLLPDLSPDDRVHWALNINALETDAQVHCWAAIGVQLWWIGTELIPEFQPLSKAGLIFYPAVSLLPVSILFLKFIYCIFLWLKKKFYYIRDTGEQNLLDNRSKRFEYGNNNKKNPLKQNIDGSALSTVISEAYVDEIVYNLYLPSHLHNH